MVVLLCTKLMGSSGEPGLRVMGTLMDITERKRRESDLERLAFEDPLAGVASRRALDELLRAPRSSSLSPEIDSASNPFFIRERRVNMLWTLLMVLVVLWALGFLTGNAFGGLIHLLLVVALVVFVFRLLSGRNAT